MKVDYLYWQFDQKINRLECEGIYVSTFKYIKIQADKNQTVTIT